jgi:hypothetical protein
MSDTDDDQLSAKQGVELDQLEGPPSSEINED